MMGNELLRITLVNVIPSKTEMLLWFSKIPQFHIAIGDGWLSIQRKHIFEMCYLLGCRKIFLLGSSLVHQQFLGSV